MAQKSFLNAVKWSYTATWGERAFSALVTLVLAAMLGPKDFGIITLCMIYITFIQMFLEQGLVSALIQKKDLEAEHLDSVFWMNMLLSLVLAGLSILFSRWWGNMNHLARLSDIITVLSLCIPIQGLTIVQSALLQRNLDFKSLSIRSNAAVLVGGGTALGMAYAGFGVWALVGQQVARDLAALGLLWKFSAWRPRFKFSPGHLKGLLGFSVSTFVAQLANFADTQASAILTGVFFGPSAVGLYRLADRLAGTVLATTTSAIHAASLPEFSRQQNSAPELRRSVLTCIRMSSTITLPAMVGLAAVSHPLMATLGPRWVPASDVLKLLSVSGMVLTFAIYTGPLLQALSRTRYLIVLEWGRTLVGIALLVAAGLMVRNAPIRWQVMGIALARLASGACFVAPLYICILLRQCGIPFRHFIASVAPSAAAAASVVGAVALFNVCGYLTDKGPKTHLVTDASLGAVAGLLTLLSLDVRLRLSTFGLMKRAFARPA